jgi:hypothetical protein
MKLVVVGAAAGVGVVLLVLSAGVGLEPILRPLMPFENQAAQVEVQVQPPPPAINPPPVVPVTAAPETSAETPEPEDRAVVPAPEPTRRTLAEGPPESRVPSSDPGAPTPPEEEPVEPAPIEEPEPVIEQPQSDGGQSGSPPPLELPPVEEQQVTRPVEDGDGDALDEDDDRVIELATPPDTGEDDASSGQGKKNGKG